VGPSNERHLLRAIEAVLALPARRIGVFGLAFKENTDDVRESAVLTLLEHLVRNGCSFRVFDPQVRPEQLYGSNLRYLRAAIPQIDEVFEPNLDGLLAWADQIVIAQKPAGLFAERIAASGLPTLNFVDSIPAPRQLH